MPLQPLLVEPNSQNLYCFCQQPETVDMIQCDACSEWFHAQCVSIDLASIENIDSLEFQCPRCLPAKEATSKLVSSASEPDQVTSPKTAIPSIMTSTKGS